MHTLYLTESEERLFNALPDTLREGWDVQPSHCSYEDTALQRKIRLETMNVADPALTALRKKAAGISAVQEIDALLANVDLSALNNADFQEILYAMGPNALEVLISAMLREASSDEMIEQAAALSSMRHLLFGDQS